MLLPNIATVHYFLRIPATLWPTAPYSRGIFVVCCLPLYILGVRLLLGVLPTAWCIGIRLLHVLLFHILRTIHIVFLLALLLFPFAGVFSHIAGIIIFLAPFARLLYPLLALPAMVCFLFVV